MIACSNSFPFEKPQMNHLTFIKYLIYFLNVKKYDEEEI